ncbi:hypothetical protein F5887DRAFT_1082781 [Amanita rubescens]|nr:hypothetical protein F5887DRAFT_1082781 [Amanita rubescens]
MSAPYYRSDYDQANRPTDFHRSSSLRPHRDHEQEPLSLTSAFDGLDLNGTRDTRFPPSPARSRSIHESPSRRVHTVSELGDSGASPLRQGIGGPWESIDSQQRLRDFSYPSNQSHPHALGPATPRDLGLYRHGPPTPAMNAMPFTFGLPSPSHGRYGGFGGDYPRDHRYQWARTQWPGSSSGSASPVTRPRHHHSFSREYRFYRSEDPYVDMRIRQTAYATANTFDRDRGVPVLCNCTTCYAHRYPTATHNNRRDWTSADEFGGAREARGATRYQREAYPIPRSSYYSPRMAHFPQSARDDDWPGLGYPDENYRSEFQEYNNPSSFGDRNDYRSGERRYGDWDSNFPGRYPTGLGGYHGNRNDDYDYDSDDSWHNSAGSEHEYSDSGSYTGYRHYDNYSDGEYSGFGGD